METGCGRSTLLLSHLSKDHQVFTFTNSDTDFKANDSYERVIATPLFNADTTRFILGPTQKTLPAYTFARPFDFVLLDGPHSYPFPDLEYYFVYPHIKPGGYLIIDDIWIPTIYNLYAFLKEDAMFHLETVVANTAFFTRTTAPLLDPYGDDWPSQAYNKARFPIVHTPPPPIEVFKDRMRNAIPKPVKNAIKKKLGWVRVSTVVCYSSSSDALLHCRRSMRPRQKCLRWDSRTIWRRRPHGSARG